LKTIKLNQKEMESEIKRGYVFVRCIPHTGFSIMYNEAAIDVEIRKISRIKGMPSLTKKSANTHGYPSASATLIGQKTATFGTVGYGVINPPLEDIMSVSKQNAGTGGHKKVGDADPNIKPELEELKRFIDTGGNANLNNEVEINMHMKTPISFVFAYPEKEIYAVYFKEKFKNMMGLNLPVFTYNGKDYPKSYQNETVDICRCISNKTNSVDLIVTLFDYYKDHQEVIHALKSFITSSTLKSYLTRNMHVSNFRNAIKLADQLRIPMDKDMKIPVIDFLKNLNQYASFDRQNKRFMSLCGNKKVDEVIEILRHGDHELFGLENQKSGQKNSINAKTEQDQQTSFLKNLWKGPEKQKKNQMGIWM
jgi:hypothetical protein